jgi:hypothetical protein
MMKLITLGAGGILASVDDIKSAPDDLAENQMVLPDCDLVPGRYRWDADRRAFMPISLGQPSSLIDSEHNATRAIWKGLKAIQRSGIIAFDRETVDWLEWYGKTIDAKG